VQKENLFTKTGIPSKKAKINYFTGKIAAKDISAKIKPSTEKIYHVTFKNGARTKLHFHDAGQTLIVTKGKGSLVMYKKIGTGMEKFKIKKLESINLNKGDCVYIPAKKLHTHGSIKKNETFSHVAINSFPKKNSEPKTIWYESDFKTIVTEKLS
jgi:quercetin dioxygenase-like cupin family protein